MAIEPSLLEAALRQYAGEAVVDHLSEYGERGLSSPPETRYLSVYIQEPRSITETDRRLTFEESRVFQCRYLDGCIAAIESNAGTVLSIVGDTIIAAFGTENLGDGPRQACLAATTYSSFGEEFRQWCRTKELPEIEWRIGIGTGEVFFGNHGASRRKQFGVVGDVVNLAGRLCALAPGYNLGILTERNTAAGAGQGFKFREVDKVRVKGREGSHSLYAVEVDS